MKNLGRRPRSGNPGAPDDGFRNIIRQVLERDAQLRELDLPEGLGAAVEGVTLSYEDAQFELDTLDPIRRKAQGLARRLRQALADLADAETKRPSRIDREGRASSVWSRVSDGGTKAATATTPTRPTMTEAQREARIKTMLQLGHPNAVRQLLPYLLVQLKPTLRKRGARRTLASILQEEARKAGLGDRRTGRFLVAMGLEPAADVETLKDRVRGRRRRRGGK